jgi:hypothetical protein
MFLLYFVSKWKLKLNLLLVCEDCKKEIPLETEFSCEICNREDEDEEDEVSNEEPPKSKELPVFCKRCTDTCENCEVRGCNKCVKSVCCDCSVSMCEDCRDDNDVLCGCSGNCYTCGTEVHRGSEGWPCGECEIWYCDDCRRGDNPCKECGPEADEEEAVVEAGPEVDAVEAGAAEEKIRH